MSVITSALKQKFRDPVFAFQYTQVVRYVVSFLISIIMVRSALAADDLGRYEILIFIAGALTVFWTGGIRNALFAFYAKLDPNDQHRLPTQIFWLLCGICIVIALFVGVFPQTVMAIFTQNADYTLYFYLILILLLSVPPILVDAIFFLRKDIKALLSYTHWSQLVSLVLTLMVAVFMPTIEYFIYALLLSYSLRFGYLVFDVLGSAAFDISFDLMRRYAIFAMPLIGTVFLGSMMDMIDGWFVTYYFDESYFPVFRYGAREMPLSAVLMSSLSMAIIPSLSADSQGIIMLKRKVTSLMHWLFPVSGLLMIISPILFPLVYEAAYLDSAFIFNIYLLILISRVLLPQSICLAHHKTGIIILSGMIEVVANILLSFWWMQIWGIFGLAMATVVAYFVQKIILVMYNRQKFGISLTDYIDLKYYVFYSLSLIGIFFITLYIWK